MIDEMESHIKIIERQFFNELWNERNLAIADDIFTEDFITEAISLEPSNWVSVHGKGPSSMRHHIKWWLEIIPDAKMRVIDITATENKVITNWELQGTAQGEIFGVKQKNQGVRIFGCTISIFQGNKVNLNKTLFDRLGFFQQIELLPSTEKIMQQE